MHVERKVGAFLDHVVQRADLVLGSAGPGPACPAPAPCTVASCGSVKRAPRRVAATAASWLASTRSYSVALRAGELAVGREGAGDVAGVAVELAAGVDQHQLAVAHRARRRRGSAARRRWRRRPRWSRRPGTASRGWRNSCSSSASRWYSRTSWPSRSMAALTLHGANVGPRADLRGAAHGGLLVGVFDQAHLVEQAAQVALLLGAQRAIAHAGAHRLQPAVDAAFQPCVGRKRVPDGAPVFQQPGQLRRPARSPRRPRRTPSAPMAALGPQAVAVPDFALQVFGLAKQRGLAVARDDQPGVGLGEAGQVIKVAVVPEQKVAVAVAGALGRGGNDGNAAGPQLGGEAGAAFGVEGERGVGSQGGFIAPGVAEGALGEAFSACRRSGVPTSVQRPVYSSALTSPAAMAARSSGASGAADALRVARRDVAPGRVKQRAAVQADGAVGVAARGRLRAGSAPGPRGSGRSRRAGCVRGWAPARGAPARRWR